MMAQRMVLHDHKAGMRVTTRMALENSWRTAHIDIKPTMLAMMARTICTTVR
jgi:hypothetical protein